MPLKTPTGYDQARKADTGLVDGRKARSERSRQQIIDALFKLVRSGKVQPSAALVAETAKVSLRTVFRHFEDMDSLYKEMTTQCETQFLPTFMKPYESPDWKGRLAEQCERRLQCFEDVMFLRTCTEARRHQSDVLAEDHRRFFRLEQSGIEAILPERLKSDISLVASLDVALCFETYRRLRQDTGLSQAQTRAAVSRLLDIIVAETAS